MKKNFFFVLILCLLISGCSKKNILEGNWETITLLKDGQKQDLYDSNIVFKPGENFYEVKGCAGVNLFNVYVKDKGKSVETFGMVNTGFMGDSDAMVFEDMFFDAFLNSDSYRIEKEVLTFYNHEKNLELKLLKSN